MTQQGLQEWIAEIEKSCNVCIHLKDQGWQTLTRMYAERLAFLRDADQSAGFAIRSTDKICKSEKLVLVTKGTLPTKDFL